VVGGGRSVRQGEGGDEIGQVALAVLRTRKWGEGGGEGTGNREVNTSAEVSRELKRLIRRQQDKHISKRCLALRCFARACSRMESYEGQTSA